MSVSTAITIGDAKLSVNIMPSKWQKEDDPLWAELIKESWGRRDLIESQPIVTVQVAKKFRLSTQIIIRSEMKEMYERITKAYETEPDTAGIIVTGQPGCGKSTSISYFMLEQLAARRPVYVMTTGEQVFFISNEGTWSSSAAELNRTRDFIVPESHKVWCLVDSVGAKDAGEPKRLILDSGFAVYVPSPAPKRFIGWKNDRDIPLFIMNPWAPLDLSDWFQQVFLRGRTLSAKEEELLLNAQYDCAPTPRALNSYLKSQRQQFDRVTNHYAKSVLEAIDKLKRDTSQLEAILNVPAEGGYESSISHQLLCVHRIPQSDEPRDYQGVIDDSAYQDLASPRICDELIKTYQVWRLQDSCKYYWHFSAITNLSTGAGSLFETLFIKQVTTPNMTDLKFGLFKALDLAPSPLRASPSNTRKSAKPKIEFRGTTLAESSPKSVLCWSNSDAFELDPGASEEAESQADSASDAADASSLDMPPQPSWDQGYTLKQYESIESVTPAPRTLYVPSKRNNALFDALLLQEDSPISPSVSTSPNATLWVIQVTTAKTHGGAESGYQDITNVYRRISGNYGRLRIAYVLVVPPKYHLIEWAFENAEKQAKYVQPSYGNVFIQVLAVNRS